MITITVTLISKFMKKNNLALIRIAFIFFFLLVLLPLMASCKNELEILDDESEYIYVAEYIPLPCSVGEITETTYYNEKIYFSINESVENHNNSLLTDFVTAGFYYMHLDGTNLTKLSNYYPAVAAPDNTSGNTQIRNIVIDDNGNLWFIEEYNYYIYNLPSDADINKINPFEYSGYIENVLSGTNISKINAETGERLLTIDIDNIINYDSYDYVSSFIIDANDNIHIISWNTIFEYASIYILDQKGSIRLYNKLNSHYNSNSCFLRLTDNSVALVSNAYQSEESSNQVFELLTFDIEQMSVGCSRTIPALNPQLYNKPHIYAGNNKFDFFYVDSAYVYSLAADSGEMIRQLSWYDSSVIIYSIENFFALPDGRFICINYAWNKQVPYEIIMLTKKHISELPDKTILTLATIDMSRNARDAVNEFNRKSLDYRIDVVDYSMYSIGNDRQPAIDRLTTEIVSGKIPDILDVSALQYKEFAQAGYLADLYQFIDADSEYNRDNLVQAVFQSQEINGCLYQIFPLFNINSLIGHPTVVGNSMGWNVEELKTTLDKYLDADLPMGVMPITKSVFLIKAVEVGINDYLNWDKAEAYFDTPHFIQLLEICMRLPDDIDWATVNPGQNFNISLNEAISEGRQIMLDTIISDFYILQYHKALFGGEIVYKGYPNSGKNGHIIFGDDCRFAIMENSASKDAAWTFVRMFLDADRQQSMIASELRFPTNQVAFNKRIEEALRNNKGGYINDMPLEPVTQDEIDMIIALIETAGERTNQSGDDTIRNIIRECVTEFFYGNASAAVVADNIQSRVLIYLSERS